jgi:hypothetical protein
MPDKDNLEGEVTEMEDDNEDTEGSDSEPDPAAVLNKSDRRKAEEAGFNG